jgi:hypothetical protein
LNQAYVGRLKHRAFAFIEECYDDGHNYQLHKLRILLTEVEIALSKIWSIKVDNAKYDHESSEDDNTDDNAYTTECTINDSRLARIALDQEIEEAFKTYKFTVNLNNEKYLLEDKLFKVVDKKTDSWKYYKLCDDGLGLGNLVIMITNIVLAVDKIGGFEDNYVPDYRVMGNTTLNTFRPYNIPIGECNRYCEQFTIEQIKRTYLCVLTKWPILIVMVDNLRVMASTLKTVESFRATYKIRYYKGQLMLSYTGNQPKK